MNKQELEAYLKRAYQLGQLYWSQAGRYADGYPRTLFFSEPKIEAAVKRPFTPTLIGKTVVVYSSGFPDGVIRKILNETQDKIIFNECGDYHTKSQIQEIHEVLPENLLKK